VVVRLSGTNVEQGRGIILESGLAIELTETLAEAAQAAVRLAAAATAEHS